jgi:ATP-dependent Clp protease adaptor protein ClpS
MLNKMSFMNNAQLFGMSNKQSTSKRGKWQIILHDDDHNTFDHVIDCLVEVCGHNYYQAVQCATITHNNNQCSIFVDDWYTCEDVGDMLQRNGLMISVTKFKNKKQ